MRRWIPALLLACTQPAPAPQPPAVEEKPVATAVPVRCVGPVRDEPVEQLKIGQRSWQLRGSTLVLQDQVAALRLGVLSDIKDSAEENQANLRAFAAWFAAEQVDAVVITGDSGLGGSDIETNIAQLLSLDVPIFNIIGNRESKTFYQASMAKLHRAHPRVLDLGHVRRVDTSVVDLVSLPGYYDPAFADEDACIYGPDDIAAAGAIMAGCDSPVLFVSHGPPRQAGERALDRTAQGANVGDPALAALLRKYNVPFGLFGNIHEAGGGATTPEGTTRLPMGRPQPALYLNPGPVDSVRWPMNEGPESSGMAAVVYFEAGQARFEIKRM